MNKIDRRFLTNIGLFIEGMQATAPNNLSSGYRCIVASNPSGVFSGHSVGEIAYYDGTNWIFSTPEKNDICFDADNIYRYDGTEWVILKYSMEKPLLKVDYVLKLGLRMLNTPEEFIVGERFLETDYGRVLTCIGKEKIEDFSYGVIIPDNTTLIYSVVISGKKTVRLGIYNRSYSNKVTFENYSNFCSEYNLDAPILELSTGTLWGIKEKSENEQVLYRIGEGYTRDIDKTIGAVDDIILAIGETNPLTAAIGDKFFNSSNDTLYTASAVNTWGTGNVLIDNSLYRFLSKQENCIYSIDKVNGEKFVNRSVLLGGEIFFNNADKCVYVYNAEDNRYDKVSAESSSEKPLTETHTLTSAELTAKSFTLSNSVATGEETNILCFVQGVAQAAGIAFEVSGNSFSWDTKTLDGNLNAGDVFIIHYVKA